MQIKYYLANLWLWLSRKPYRYRTLKKRVKSFGETLGLPDVPLPEGRYQSWITFDKLQTKKDLLEREE